VNVVDERPGTVGWVAPEPAWMLRAAHAMALDGRVWVFDPFDAEGAEERVRALGEPVGVVQLFARHARDCAAWAGRLGVELHVLPEALPGWQTIPIPGPMGWREVALWDPDSATLMCAEALANAPGYSGDRVGVHPFLRLTPPTDLGDLPVRHLLLGHGAGVHGEDAQRAVTDALRTSRTGIPRFFAGSVRRLLPF